MNMKNSKQCPTVSILVPAYNVERYLVQSIGSVLEQTFTDYEALLIDDGSTDGTLALLEDYARSDPRFRVISKVNSGYGASMNRGLREARGKYIAILEPDDFYTPRALELLVSAIQSCTADVAKANFWFYWSEPKKRCEAFYFIDSEWDGMCVCPLDRRELFLRKPSIWSGLYRRSFLEKNGICFLETPGASYQDASFNFKVWSCAQRVACVADKILCYRQDNEHSSVNSPDKVFCVCDEYAEMERFIEGLSEKRRMTLKPIEERMKLNAYLWNYDRLSNHLKHAFLMRAHNEFLVDLKNGFRDFSSFEEHERADFMAIARKPAVFEKARAAYQHNGVIDAPKYYYAIGGPLLIMRIVKSRLMGRG